MNGTDFVTVTEAARRVAISRPTLRRLIARGELEAFVTPTDRRLVLVRSGDLDALREPRPVGAGGGTMTNAA